MAKGKNRKKPRDEPDAESGEATSKGSPEPTFPADPPRPNIALLSGSVLLFVVWLVFLIYRTLTA